jgi:hypothetical protein
VRIVRWRSGPCILEDWNALEGGRGNVRGDTAATRSGDGGVTKVRNPTVREHRELRSGGEV